MGDLVVLCGDIALLIKVFGAHLGNMHIYQVRIMTVDFHHLVRVLAIDVYVVVGAHVLMR